LVKARLLDGVESYPGTVAFILYLRRLGIKTAVVTSSENCETILKAAKIEDLFDAQVDGLTLVEQRLAGKPAPDSFLKAAEMLHVPPQRAVVVEDAISGVQAGERGGFGLVIGVARKNNAGDESTKHRGPTLVHDLAELLGTSAPPLETAAWINRGTNAPSRTAEATNPGLSPKRMEHARKPPPAGIYGPDGNRPCFGKWISWHARKSGRGNPLRPGRDIREWIL
jgi:HAD superfamily hydrolase (TIGR01509 family)